MTPDTELFSSDVTPANPRLRVTKDALCKGYADNILMLYDIDETHTDYWEAVVADYTDYYGDYKRSYPQLPDPETFSYAIDAIKMIAQAIALPPKGATRENGVPLRTELEPFRYAKNLLAHIGTPSDVKEAQDALGENPKPISVISNVSSSMGAAQFDHNEMNETYSSLALFCNTLQQETVRLCLRVQELQHARPSHPLPSTR